MFSERQQGFLRAGLCPWFTHHHAQHSSGHSQGSIRCGDLTSPPGKPPVPVGTAARTLLVRIGFSSLPAAAIPPARPLSQAVPSAGSLPLSSSPCLRVCSLSAPPSSGCLPQALHFPSILCTGSWHSHWSPLGLYLTCLPAWSGEERPKRLFLRKGDPEPVGGLPGPLPPKARQLGAGPLKQERA